MAPELSTFGPDRIAARWLILCGLVQTGSVPSQRLRLTRLALVRHLALVFANQKLAE